MTHNPPTVPTPVPTSLSSFLEQTASTGARLDVEIGGIPFLLKPTQENPMIREVRRGKRDMFDQSKEAGEQTFDQWWLRSQATYHGGSGQLFSDTGTVDAEVSRTRFFTSSQMDCFTTVGAATPRGGATLTAIGNVVRAVAFRQGGIPRIAVAINSDDIQVYGLDGILVGTIDLGEPASVVLDLTSDGENLYAAINDKVKKVDGSGVVTTYATLSMTLPVRIAWVADRLIVCHGPNVYEAVGAIPIVLDAGELKFTHPAAGWYWSSIAEGPNGIYLSGYVGIKGQVWSLSMIESTGSSLDLGNPTLQISMPTGEIVYDLFFYVNSLFVLGTSEGARVGAFDPASGRPQFGPLSYDESPVRAIGALRESAILGADQGVFSLDLGRLVDRSGKYAYSHRHNITGDRYVSIVTTGNLATPSVFAFTEAGVEIEAADCSGSLTTSWFTWSTTEKKRAYFVTVTGKVTTGTATVTVENYEGNTVTFSLTPSATRTAWEFGLSLPESTAYRATVSFSAGTDVNFLNSIQLKALPQEKRYQTIVWPLLIANRQQTSSGQTFGYDHFGVHRLQALLRMAQDNTTITVRDWIFNESYTAQVEDIQFQQQHGIAPQNGAQIDGIASVVLRLTK